MRVPRLPGRFAPGRPARGARRRPRVTSKSMKASARRPPKRFEMLRTEITASAGIRDPPVRSECGGGERRQPLSDAHEPVGLVEHDQNEEATVDEEKRIAQGGDGE